MMLTSGMIDRDGRTVRVTKFTDTGNILIVTDGVGVAYLTREQARSMVSLIMGDKVTVDPLLK